MYIPKNKIITNLYTNGLEINSPENQQYFYIVDTGEIYEGYYWKDYKGKYYTGKNPNEKPTLELQLKQINEIPIDSSPIVEYTLSNSNTYPPTINSDEANMWDPLLPEEYESIFFSSTEPTRNLNLPSQYYPSPSKEDYKLGSFRRYFCVKANESVFLEIDSKTYDALFTHDKKWRWELYDPFYLEWVLTGDQNDVRTSNFNTTKIINVASKGFQKFLRFNYLKFYQSLSNESTIEIPPRSTPPSPSSPSTQNY